MLKSIAGLIMGAFFCASAFGQTADECIAQYEELRADFRAAAAANGMASAPEPYCVEEGNLISLDAEGPMTPISCEGLGEDHWHLKAKSILGKDSACVLRLYGLQGDQLQAHPGCGTPEMRIDLPANEGAEWRKYLRGECGQ